MIIIRPTLVLVKVNLLFSCKQIGQIISISFELVSSLTICEMAYRIFFTFSLH